MTNPLSFGYALSDEKIESYITLGYPCRYNSCSCKCTQEEAIKYHRILKYFGNVKFLMKHPNDINSKIGIWYKGYIYWSNLCYRESLFKAIQFHRRNHKHIRIALDFN